MDARQRKTPPPGGWPPKTTGSLEPLAGRCGAQLTRTGEKYGTAARYCMIVTKDGKRCSRMGHDGGKLVGNINGNFRHGRYAKSQFDGVLPPGLRRHLDPERIKDAASCGEQLLLVDARTGQVLEAIRDFDPVGAVAGTRGALGLLRLALELREGDSATSAAVRAVGAIEALEHLLDQQAAVASGWDELHRLFDTRAKLARAELGFQKMLSENILLGQVTTFMASLVAEARMLTDDRRKLSDYAVRVMALGRGLAPALAAGNEDVVDAEVVEEER